MAQQWHTIDPSLYPGEEIVSVAGLPVRVKRAGDLVFAHPKTFGATYSEWAEALGVTRDDIRRVSQRSRTHTLVFLEEVDGE